MGDIKYEIALCITLIFIFASADIYFIALAIKYKRKDAKFSEKCKWATISSSVIVIILIIILFLSLQG